MHFINFFWNAVFPYRGEIAFFRFLPYVWYLVYPRLKKSLQKTPKINFLNSKYIIQHKNRHLAFKVPE